MDEKRENTIATLAMVFPDLHVQVNELIKPTTDSMVRFCEALLDTLYIDIEQINIIIMQFMDDLNAHENVLRNYLLYRCTRGILNDLKLNVFKTSFTLLDVLSPTPRQYSFVMMIISNTLVYTNDQMDVMNLIQKQMEDGAQDIEKVHTENNELTTQANIQAMVLSDLGHNFEKIQGEMQGTIELYKKQRQGYGNILDGIEICRKENVEGEAEETMLIEALCKEQARSSERNHLLVDDCDAITAELERIETELANEESYESDYAMNLYVKDGAELKYHSYVATVDAFLEQNPVKWILELYDAQVLNKASKPEFGKQLQHASTAQNDAQSTIRKLEAELSLMQEEQQALQVQTEAKHAVLEQEIRLLQEEYDASAREQKKNEDRTTEINQEIQVCEKSCLDYELTMNKLNKFNENLCKTLLEKFEHFHNTVYQQFGEIQLYSERVQISFF